MFVSLACLCAAFSSCENDEAFIRGNSLSKMRLTPSFYVPEWWDGESQINGPIMNEVGTLNYPVAANTVDTCEYYIYFIYGSPFNAYDRQFYNRIQVQYRYAPDTYEHPQTLENAPESDWHYLGEEYPKGVYDNGIVKLKSPNISDLDIDAHHFPKDRINLRIRILHERYPIKEGKDTIFNNTVLSTKWTVIHNGDGVYNNEYGFLPEEAGEYGSLRFNITPASSSRWYSFSGQVFVYGNGYTETGLVPGEGTYYFPKPAKQGQWEVTIELSESPNLEPGITRFKTFSGNYDSSTQEINISFSIDDFKI